MAAGEGNYRTTVNNFNNYNNFNICLTGKVKPK